MKNSILFIFRQFVFWMLFFFLQRGLFLAFYYNHLQSSEIPLSEVMLTFYHALWLDVSTASYLLVWPFFLQAIQMYYPSRWLNLANNVYAALIILVNLLITTGELAIYGEWKTKLSYKALAYLEHPDEVFNSYSTTGFILLTSLVVFGFLFIFRIYRKFVGRAVSNDSRMRWPGFVLYFVAIPVLLFTGIRGGFQAIPITSSVAYFSNHNILNLAAINNSYNLVFSILEYREMNSRNVFKTLPEEKAGFIVQQLHHLKKDTTISVLNHQRPNIVILLLESFSGDLLESLGGLPGITPRIHDLEKEGLLFTSFYATGNRSQQAMAGIYGGLPALPVVTLTNYPDKYAAVPSLISYLKPIGYHTSFYFGGQLNYGNIKSYLVANDFDLVVEGKDIVLDIPRGKLGIHDVDLLTYYARELSHLPQPFFSTVFTLSSHSPYDQPGERKIDFVDLERDFVNSAHYTDSAVGVFFDLVKQEPWFDHTLFIVVADHSHNSYHNYPLQSFEYHKIPFLMLGGALRDSVKGSQDDRIFSNVDITATLLKQLGQPTDAFFWSKNMFNPYSPEFAYFDLNDGFGWKTPEGHVVVNLQHNKLYQSGGDISVRDTLVLQGQSYVQVLFDEFLGY
ncbi:MAG: sulfatase-like hydrolase/transferase [Bacteroidetes bacterium]|nr:sulfatase-like hydrolase/transferase [Bacteroidota bacterium]